MDPHSTPTTPKVIKPQSNVLNVRILSPKKMLYLAKAQAVSSVNSLGKFDILAQHANFITLVKNKPIVIWKMTGEKVEFKFNLAIILAINNNVTVYTDIGNISDTKNSPLG